MSPRETLEIHQSHLINTSIASYSAASVSPDLQPQIALGNFFTRRTFLSFEILIPHFFLYSDVPRGCTEIWQVSVNFYTNYVIVFFVYLSILRVKFCFFMKNWCFSVALISVVPLCHFLWINAAIRGVQVSLCHSVSMNNHLLVIFCSQRCLFSVADTSGGQTLLAG